LIDPWDNNLGNQASGAKPEYWVGAAEWIGNPGDGYLLYTLDQVIIFEHRPGITILELQEIEPDPDPDPDPEPGPEPDPDPEPEPGTFEDHVLYHLGQIEAHLGVIQDIMQRIAQSAYWIYATMNPDEPEGQ